jgi:adenosylhomocysteine nucleosidase
VSATHGRAANVPAPALIAVACGLLAEARLVAGTHAVAIAGGGDTVRLESELLRLCAGGARAIISFGMAAGLDPMLPAGAVVVADQVLSGSQRWLTDAMWSARMRLALPGSIGAAVAGVDGPLVRPRDKQALFEATEAAAADMESHVAARAAAQAGLPLAVLRVVADDSRQALPPAAVAGMRSDGSIAVGAVLASLARNPAQGPALMRLARSSRTAMRALSDSRSRLGEDLALSSA